MCKSTLFLKIAQVASLATVVTTFSVAVSAQPVANPNVSCPEGTQLVAKFNWNSAYVFEKPVGNEGIITVGGDALTGNWSATIPVSYVILKGSTQTYQYATNSNSGGFSYLDLLPNNGGQHPAISNIQFCAPKVPQMCEDWDFVKDSFTDGTAIEKRVNGKGGVSWATIYGGNQFEIYGMALKQEGNDILVAINTNIPLQGNDLSEFIAAEGLTLTDNLIGLGDLILNFEGTKYGVHFTNNDAGVQEFGVYTNISTKDVTASNIGWSSLTKYRKYVTDAGKTPSLGDVTFDEGYFNLAGKNTYGQIVIDKGTKIADIQMLDSAKLPNFATAFGTAVGQYTHGFKFTKTAQMTGDVTAHLFAECFNDGVALKTNIAGSCKPLLGEGLNNLTTTADQAGITLSWQIEGDSIAVLNVWRAELGADGKYINITKIAEDLDADSLTDAAVTAGVTYYYAVEQISFTAENKFSEVVSAVAQ